MTAKRLDRFVNRRYVRRRLCFLTLLAALLLAGLWGCGRGEDASPPPGSGPRFEGTALPAPSDLLNIQSSVYFDEATGNITCLAFSAETEPLPEGGYGQKLNWYLLTSKPGGDEIGQEILPLEPDVSVMKSLISEDEAVFLCTYVRTADTQNGPRDVFLGRYGRHTGEVTVSASITPFFPSEGYWDAALTEDRDGYLYVGAGREVLVFTPDFIYVRSVRMTDGVDSLGLDERGEPVAAAGIFVGDTLYRGVFSLDREKGEAAERFRVRSWDGCGNATFAPGRDLYLTDRTGIWGVVSKENGGTGEAVLVMDFTASDVIPENSFLGGIIDADRIVMVERSMDGEQNWVPCLSLYTRAEEQDLSDVTVLALAYDRADSRLTSKIVAFNKAHRDIRITPVDYSKDGEERLSLDMAAGSLRPDIVVTSPDGGCAAQIYKKGLYADLTPYLAADDLVNGENLFGAVKHAFDDGKGGIWGLSTTFSLVTLAAREDMLPQDLLDRGYWNLSELTAFAASLPEGVSFMQVPCREYFAAILTASDGLGEFIDREAGVCSFDGPAFRGVLDYMLSLPGFEELKASGFFTGEADYLPFIEGKIALRDAVIESPGEVMELETLFGTEDYALIGLPTPVRRDGAGIRADMNDAVILTSFCEHPDEAWAVICSLFEGEIRMTVTVSGEPRDPIPALRSQLDFMIDTYMQGGMEFRFYYDGETVMRPGDPDDPTDPAALEKPGVVSFFTEEAREELVSVLDRAGSPIMGTTDQQILEIAGEEMSALFAGSCTAEECARRIQSRVGILLAEGK